MTTVHIESFLIKQIQDVGKQYGLSKILDFL
jgi:hypothetical protein